MNKKRIRGIKVQLTGIGILLASIALSNLANWMIYGVAATVLYVSGLLLCIIGLFIKD